MDDSLEVRKFPSPHGDKFQLEGISRTRKKLPFPSPHGDKFQREELDEIIDTLSFRPLTGINFNAYDYIEIIYQYWFPSPHGDKFQQGVRQKVRLDRAVSVPSRG